MVILDLMLPGMDGIEVCQRLRSGGNIPILMLTAKDALQDRVQGLDAGADDYMTAVRARRCWRIQPAAPHADGTSPGDHLRRPDADTSTRQPRQRTVILLTAMNDL
jgi:PleD family two-component response regulator